MHSDSLPSLAGTTTYTARRARRPGSHRRASVAAQGAAVCSRGAQLGALMGQVRVRYS
jgi:hypothetical protein